MCFFLVASTAACAPAGPAAGPDDSPGIDARPTGSPGDKKDTRPAATGGVDAAVAAQDTGPDVAGPSAGGNKTDVAAAADTPPLPSGNAGALDVATGDKVVNKCFAITKTTGADVTTETAPALAAGDTVLLHQVQDKIGPSGDQTDVTTAARLKDAGVWELAQVTAVDGATIRLAKAPKISYGGGDGRAAQACHVPTFTTVNVAAGAKIVAEAWNGKTGGVVAFTAAGAVTVEGEITATGLGGRGGPWDKNRFRPDSGGDVRGLSGNDYADGLGGRKGEGIDGGGFGPTKGGRGNHVNGAGGGNSTHAAGAGGANAGRGGFGGQQHGNYGGGEQTRGRGGAAIKLPLAERLVMGGGGGQGQQVTNDQPPKWCKSSGFVTVQNMLTAGGAGGGVILVTADALKGAGKITANGLIGGCAESDGAGGGGAGGSIWLKATTGGFTGTVSANGGPGADNVNSNNRVGPGGGGGGGRVRIEVPGGLKAEVKAGAAGTHHAVDPAARGPRDKNTWGATAGGDGVVETP